MLSNQLRDKILQKLNLQLGSPSVENLDQILQSYTRTIPWESATRNVRRIEKKNDYAACPRWPEEFWEIALSQGTGGTCFETNLAIYALLSTLGYTGYLTINNMGKNLGCHTAIVVTLENEKWLFDGGYPMECTLPLDPLNQSVKQAKFLTYHTVPTENNTYQILRSRHPKPYIFTLFDTPIDVESYKTAAANDYRPEGNFNNSIVINKIVDEKMVRFSTWADDVMFEAFTADPAGGAAVREIFETDGDLPQALADRFNMPKDVCAQGLNIIAEAK